MAQNTNNKKGFTIIEVVLVLAIAGLIFLMVFVALPALQRSQRDTQRRQDLSRVVTALVQYQTNNRTKRNNLPGAGEASYANFGEETGFTPTNDADCKKAACLFVKNYMNASGATENTFVDPDGVPYNVVITSNYSKGTDLDIPTIGDGSSVKLEGSGSEGYTVGGTDPVPQHVLYIIPGGQCSGESVVSSELRHFAMLYKLEGSGTYCVGSDNQ